MDNWKADFFYGASPEIFNRARVLRKNMTSAELHLWERLRDKKINGYRFRRQHPIYTYIADFYCHKAKLVVEIDGQIHNKTDIKEYDQDREKKMLSLGITTIRFKNDEIFNDIEKVVCQIEYHLNNYIENAGLPNWG